MGTTNTSTYTDAYGTTYAKAKGAYSLTSNEGKSNARTFYNYMTQYAGYTRNAALAILGNMYAESGLNPWRWQGDTVRAKSTTSYPSIGYGLVQWTPAEKYVKNVTAKGYSSFAPNFSDENGDAKDYKAQLYFMDKINARTIGGYGPQYAINNNYNYRITWEQFKTGNYSVPYLTAAWLHNFERPADQSERVEQERYTYAQDIAQIIGGGSTATYIWPLPGYDYLSTRFGEPDPWGVPHRGIDIPAPSGTPILACAGGTVIFSGWADDYGNYVYLQHANGMRTVYAHMIRTNVTTGQTVTQGQVIGFVGTTGPSTGNHLHLEFILNGTLVDPLNYITPGGDAPPIPLPTTRTGIAPIICELRRRKVVQ